MSQHYPQTIATELSLATTQVISTIGLLDDGSTVPFIARYRKEATQNLDEVAITQIRDRLNQLKELDKRRITVLESIEKQGKLTPELKKKIDTAETLAVLEDIYLPYRPKRRTKATMAKEKGLEPLAKAIFDQTGIDPEKEAVVYINKEKKVNSVDDALAGARDIMAEWINEESQTRDQLRTLFQKNSILRSNVLKGKETVGIKFKDYFQWEEPAIKIPSHRILAVRRGEKEGMLTLHIQPPEEKAISILEAIFLKGQGEDSHQVHLALQDSYKRLLSLSLETEIRVELKKRADAEAITVFANNLRELLMAPPLGQKNVLAVDPGLRTGCKLVCLNRQGKLMINDTIYLVGSEHQKQAAIQTVQNLCQQYDIEVIAIGNGTAGRATENFIRNLTLSNTPDIIIVNESGASIYSASEAAREEFPDHDVTVRGSVSIGRRLMDPLAELVKIDPKSIGVGQYQHDVDQKLLRQSLDDVVVSCVNQVGVEVNTASKQLLMYVSGLGEKRAQTLVDHRQKHGAFQSREQLKTVPGLGAKAFEQAAGFLRILEGNNPLDASAVHPDSYAIIQTMTQDLSCTVQNLMQDTQLQNKINLNKYVTEIIGLPTLTDIKNELAKPGRDPRPAFQIFKFKEGIEKMADLAPGMKLPGVVTNVTAFGAFIDIGVHQDGLAHISQLSDRYIKDPHEIVKVHQQVTVTVLEIDTPRKRIALSMKKN